MGGDNVRRISPGAKRDRELPENKIQWRRSQEHYELFKALVKWELDDELQLMQKRWKTWTNKRLSEAGLSLFNLLAKPKAAFLEIQSSHSQPKVETISRGMDSVMETLLF